MITENSSNASSRLYNINVAFIIGEGTNYESVLDDLMKKVDEKLQLTLGSNPQALFPVEIRDDGATYFAIQQWKWYTPIL